RRIHVGVKQSSARPDDVFLWRRHAEHGGLFRTARSVDYVTALEDDPYSDWMIDEWQAEGVGTNSVLRVPARLPGSYATRTKATWYALSALVRALPDATIDIGTVLKANQIQRAADLGAKFAVSSGFDHTLTEAAASAGLFYLPGVAIATEVMAARRAILRFLKLFPAEQAGGVAFFKRFASPLGDVEFCPTGGIGPGNLADYLAQPNIICVGGQLGGRRERHGQSRLEGQ
ncbi:MAG: hypothetical protein VYD85_09825, partial [Pseudomonadota bacterium]|nr:hypothetical protein [Pseudomonadota bacterium]